MPTFDFRCVKCGHTFEFSRPFGSKTVPSCPECKSKKTEKLIAPPAVHFVGSGWYKTDSKTSSSPAPAKKKEEPAKTEAPAGTKAPEKKPEAPASKEKPKPGRQE